METTLTRSYCQMVPVEMAPDFEDEDGPGPSVPQAYAPAKMMAGDLDLQRKAVAAALVALEEWRVQWGILPQVNAAAVAAGHVLLHWER